MYKKYAVIKSANLLKLGLASHVRKRLPFCTLDQVPGRFRRTSRMGQGHISARGVDSNRVQILFILSSNQVILYQHSISKFLHVLYRILIQAQILRVRKFGKKINSQMNNCCPRKKHLYSLATKVRTGVVVMKQCPSKKRPRLIKAHPPLIKSSSTKK